MGLVGAACGGGGGNRFDGVYRAGTHTEDKAGCGAGTELGDNLLFKLETGDLLGARMVKYELCTSKDACLDLGLLSVRFTVETSDGWTDDTFTGTLKAAMIDAAVIAMLDWHPDYASRREGAESILRAGLAAAGLVASD